MKYFLFDIGNVLLNFDLKKLLRALNEGAGQSVIPFSARDVEMHDAAETGNISDEKWVEYLNESKGLSWTVDELINVWSGMFTVNPTGRELFERAQQDAEISVHTLSNIAKHHMDAIENNWNGFFDGADSLFLSYQMGVRKPHPEIYRHALDQLGVDGSQCFFIDDLSENIEAAHAAGIHAHQFLPENHAAICEAASNFFGWA